MNPALASRAAKMTVIPCHIPGIFHVAGGTQPHRVHRSMFKQFACDCQAAQSGKTCAHVIATTWFVDKLPAAGGMKASK